MTDPSASRRRGISTAAGLVVGALAYLLTLLDFSTSLTRTANALGYASNFFDFQARALIHGHLDVPRGSLGIEGFVEHGKEYMYFPLWPALLRIPVLKTTTEYDGRLTVISMALGFVLLMVMAPRLVWLVRDMLYPGVVTTWTEVGTMGLLIALVTGGTALTFVASLPWAYHEVYAWAVPFAIGAMYWMLRVLRDPTPKAIGWLAAFDLGTIMTRTTGGWAVCLTTIAIGVWVLTGRVSPGRRRIGWAVVAAGAVPLLAGITLNMIKFRHPYLFPLQDQVWTTVNAHRREALAANGGTITGPQFLPSTAMAYLRPDGIRFVDYFPFVTLPARPAQAYGDVIIDQSYRTGSITAFMPWLSLMWLFTLGYLFRPGVDQARRFLRMPFVAGVLVTGGVMGYGYMAFRYTAEFVPALVFAGTVGTCVLTQWLVRRGAWVRGAGIAVLAVFTAWSITAHMLVGYSTAATVGGGDRLRDYLWTQHHLSGGAQQRLITHSDDPPHGGSTDDIWIQGDCDAMYLNTGDAYQPWQLVERRALVFDVTLPEEPRAGRIKLIDIGTAEPGSVWLETDGKGQARLEIVNETGTYYGPYFEILDPRVVRVGIRDEPELGYAAVSSTPGGFVGFARAFEWDTDWVSKLVDISPAKLGPADLRRLGMTVREVPGLEPPLCRALLAQSEQGSAALGAR
ncbi:hypothetical protein [Nocardioides sp.]|uniref:hypothetical protein n=1 Tax=Nocardioides sp. TaxID=35761 RepID=UPI0037853039